MKNWKTISLAILLSVGATQIINAVFAPPGTALNAIETAADTSTLDKIIEGGTLKCAYIPYPPFFDIDPNTGEMYGVSYDLMEEIGKRLNINIEWTEEVGWGSLTEGLHTKRYDAVCSAVWQTSTRSLRANFSKPYGYSSVDIWVRADDERFSNDITRINQKDVKIPVIDGEATSKLVSEHFPNAEIISLSQNTPFSDVLLNVKNGKADIVLAEPKIAAEFLKAHPGSLKKVTIEKPLSAYPIAFVLPKGEVDFKATIDNTIDEIFFTRTIDTILAKNNIEKEAFHLPAQPF